MDNCVHVVTGTRFWHGPRANLCYASVEVVAVGSRTPGFAVTIFR